MDPTAAARFRTWLAAQNHRIADAPWDRIDARDKGQARVGQLSARHAAVVTLVTASLMLVALRFVVMDSEVQSQLALGFVHLVGVYVPSWHASAIRAGGLWEHVAWVLGCCTVYLAVPAVVLRVVIGLPLSEAYLLPRNYLRHLPLYALLFVPVGLLVLVVASRPDFRLHYPFFVGHLGWDQLVWEIAYALQFFALEFFFRGFILRGLSAEMGASAVLAMAAPYCMLHFGKPLPECVGSIFAGIVLGTLAMDTRSIWGGVTIHVAVAWSMDAAALAQKAEGAGRHALPLPY